MTKRALVLIDIQNDYFPGGTWTLHNIEAAAANAARVLEDARANGDLVVHVRHEALRPDAPFFVPGTEGAEINAGVQPVGDEVVVKKHFINAFKETPLRDVLDKDGIEDVTFVGAMSHMCIDAAARAAKDFGFNVTVVDNACAAKDLEFRGLTIAAPDVHAAYMAALAFAYADVVSTDDYVGRAKAA